MNSILLHMNHQLKNYQKTLEELVDAVESSNRDPWYEDRVTDALDRAHAILDNKEVQELRELCGAAYQVVGAASGPVELLENLFAASNGSEHEYDWCDIVDLREWCE